MLACLDAVSPVIAQSILQSRAGQEPITPIPVMPAEDPQRLALGERLFNDRRLSRDNTRSCSTCHDVGTNGASANARDAATDGRPLALNTLTVFNASLSFRLNWEGKYRRLEERSQTGAENPEIWRRARMRPRTSCAPIPKW
jgi:cytochrome c peroxidase